MTSSQALSQLFRIKGYQTLIPTRGQSIDLLKKEISEVKPVPSIDWNSLLSELEAQISSIKERVTGSSDLEKFSLLKAVSIILREINEK
jgi:hypothetical protein